MAIAEFANSLLVIPKTLAVNAAQDSADLVAKLRAYHNTSQINTERSSLKWYVICALSGKVLHWPGFTEFKNQNYRVELNEHVKVLLNSFHLNGHTLGFYPQT